MCIRSMGSEGAIDTSSDQESYECTNLAVVGMYSRIVFLLSPLQHLLAH